LLAFAHIFKTAGTTLTGILRRNFSTRHFDTRLIQEKPAITAAQLRRAMLLYPRIESIAGHAVRPHTDLKAAFPEIRFYTFLRDPRTRLVSSFLFTRAISIRKGEWRPRSDREIEDEFIRSMTRLWNGYCRIFAPDRGDVASAIEAIETRIDFVGLVEHFDESLALLKNWIGKPDFDPTYRRMNDLDRRGVEEWRYRSFQEGLDRLVQVTRSVAARPDVLQLIAAAQPGDVALYDHVHTKTFERMRRQYSAGPGPFSFEDSTAATDTIPGRLYRNLVGRPFVPLIAR
jgi:hypothetical protein